MKKLTSLLLCVCMALMFCTPAFAACYTFDNEGVDYQKFKGENVTINVYNWGQYMSEGEDDSMNVVKEFEKLTGIKVNYTNFATNEEMYAKLKSGSAKYDVIFPSDYMAGKMIKEGMITPLDFANIPNFTKYIDPQYTFQSYDPENLYTVPYTVGYVGLLYNSNIVQKEVKGWDILWDEDYTGDILMFNNSRDAFGIALKELGYSMNSTSERELREAAELLKKQKTVIQAYVMDEIFDKLGSGEAAVAPYYAGDYLVMSEENENLAFCLPKEGFNRFVDSMCILKGSTNREAAHKFIDFILRQDVQFENVDYIGYSSPFKAELIPEDYIDDVSYPDAKTLERSFMFDHLPTEVLGAMDKLWIEVRIS